MARKSRGKSFLGAIFAALKKSGSGKRRRRSRK